MSSPPTRRRWKRICGIAAASAALVTSALITAPAASAATAFNGTDALFGGNSTINAVDTSGANLVWNGTAAYSNDVFGGAGVGRSFQLDGNTTLTDPDTDVGNLGTGDFAIGLHYKTTSTAGRVILLSKQGTCSGHGPSWLQVALANDSVYVEVVSPDSAAEFSGSVVPTRDGNWHFVELIRHNDTLHLYFDGTQIGTRAFTGPNPSNGAPLTLGGGVCVGARPDFAGLTGDLAYVYLGAGSTYTLSNATPKAVGTIGNSGDVTFNYTNNFGTAMLATITPPDGTALADLDGPGCKRPDSNQCAYNLSGHGAPITASVAIPVNAQDGHTFTGGTFRMTDTSIPLSPASTGWDPATATANLSFSITAAETQGAPMAAWQIALPLLAGMALLAGGLVWYRRRGAAVRA